MTKDSASSQEHILLFINSWEMTLAMFITAQLHSSTTQGKNIWDLVPNYVPLLPWHMGNKDTKQVISLNTKHVKEAQLLLYQLPQSMRAKLGDLRGCQASKWGFS